MNSQAASCLLLDLEAFACKAITQAIIAPRADITGPRYAKQERDRIKSFASDLIAATELGERIEPDRRLVTAVAKAIELYDTLCCASGSKLRQLEPAFVELKKIIAEGGDL